MMAKIRDVTLMLQLLGDVDKNVQKNRFDVNRNLLFPGVVRPTSVCQDTSSLMCEILSSDAMSQIAAPPSQRDGKRYKQIFEFCTPNVNGNLNIYSLHYLFVTAELHFTLLPHQL
jgi:hypothetical protein